MGRAVFDGSNILFFPFLYRFVSVMYRTFPALYRYVPEYKPLNINQLRQISSPALGSFRAFSAIALPRPKRATIFQSILKNHASFSFKKQSS
jgi:hypothetical protein